MAGLLLELRRKISGDHRRSAYNGNTERRQEPRTAKHVPAEKDAGTGSAGIHVEQRASTFERTEDIVDKDDFLIQLDDFRDRAQKLQEQMNAREEELRRMEEQRQQEEQRQIEEQRQLEEQQRQMEEQRQMITSMQEQTEGMPYTAGISEDQMQQLEEMLRRRDENTAGISEGQMQQLEEMLRRRDKNVAGISEGQMQQLGEMLRRRDENTAEITAEVERKIDEMIAKVGAKLRELNVSVRESAEGLSSANKQSAEELKASLEQIQSQLEALKAELSDKVHKENVICYRNIQDLFKNMDTKFEDLEPFKSKTDSTRKIAVVTMVFTLINFLAVLGMLLLQLGDLIL